MIFTTLLATTLLATQGAGTIGFDKIGSSVQQISTGTVSWLQPQGTSNLYSEVETTTWAPTKFVGMTLNITGNGFKKVAYNRIFKVIVEREYILNTTIPGKFVVKSVNPDFYNPNLYQDEAIVESFFKEDKPYLIIIPADATSGSVKYGYSSIEFSSENQAGMDLHGYHRIKSWTLL